MSRAELGDPPATSTSASSTSTGDGVSTPKPVQTSMVANCIKFYLVQSGDGCPGIADGNGISLAQFYSWNPTVGSTCTKLIADDYVCVSIIGGPSATPTSTTPGNGISTPTPVQTGMVANCNKFYLVQSGNGCQAIADKNGISPTQFYSWNSAVGSTCTTLIASDYVCVGIVGGASITPTSTATGNGVSTPTPTQTGMVSNCNKFYLVQSGDGCQKIADMYGISLGNFDAWNPAVGSTCSILQASVYVCVGLIGSTGPATTTTTKGNGVATPAPTQTGMATHCDGFYLVQSGDACQKIASMYSVSLSDFYAWNPAVGVNTCATLFPGYYVCVHKIGGPTPTTSIDNGITPPTPTQAEMVVNCNKFHPVVSGDSCQAIASAAGISLATFYSWNTGVGSSCQTLFLGYYVCIGTK